jgi:AcrR family transcriptional regulator
VSPTAHVAPRRRDRLRAATISEIKQTARRFLVNDGPSAVSLRAIAREMGMTAPALYRYFASLDELLAALSTDLYDELSQYLEDARDEHPADDLESRFRAVCRAFRRWSVAHRPEFGLMFGTPLPGIDPDASYPLPEPYAAGSRFGAVFEQLFVELWRRAPFDVPADDEIPPPLRDQLNAYLARLGAPLPAGAALVFLSGWIRLYGGVALEVFGHLYFAVTDVEPLFEAELAIAATQFGMTPSRVPTSDSA